MVCLTKLLHKEPSFELAKSVVCWSSSYLLDRQRAVIDRIDPLFAPSIIMGVPQGSMLGLLLSFQFYEILCILAIPK